MNIKRNVAHTQTKGCWGCLHIGSVALYLGRNQGAYERTGWRLEVFTEYHKLRWMRGDLFRWAKWKWVNRLAKRTETWLAVNEHSKRLDADRGRYFRQVRELEAVKEAFAKANVADIRLDMMPESCISVTCTISERLYTDSRLFGGERDAQAWLAQYLADMVLQQLRGSLVSRPRCPACNPKGSRA